MLFCKTLLKIPPENEPSVDTQEKNDGENGNDEVTIKAADNGTLLDFKSLNSCFENK